MSNTVKKYNEVCGTELVSLRGACTKCFALTPNTRQYIGYGSEVHYKSASGEWKETDNNLVETKNESGDIEYRTKDAPCGFAFATDDGRPVFRMENGKDTVSILMDGILGKEKPIIENGEEIYARWLEEEERSEQDKRENIILKKISQITYKNEEAGISVLYELSGMSAHEAFAITNKPAFKYVTKQLVIPEGAEISTEGNAVAVCEKSAGEKLFGISAAYLSDKNGKHESALKPVIKQTDKSTYTITYDMSGVDMDALEYPVTIDPEYTTSQSNTPMDETTLSESDKLTNLSSRCFSETGYSNNKCNVTLVKVNTLPDIASGEVITEAVFKTAGFAEDRATPMYMSAHEITKAWAPLTVTWDNWDYERKTSETAEAFVRSSDCGFMELDITSLTNKWYKGINNGICLRRPVVNDGNANYNRMYTVKASTSKRPLLVINTVSRAGISDSGTYDSMAAGRTGEVSVDLYTGNVHVTHADTETTGERMPVSISHHYNGTEKDNDGYGCGKGWKLSLNQRVRETSGSTEYLVWEDGTGNKHWFIKQTAPSKDEEGMGLTLTRLTEDGVNIAEIKDKKDNTVRFAETESGSGEYYLVNIKDVFGNTAYLAYAAGDTEKKKPVSVTDGAGRTITFTYNADGRLTAINTPVSAAEYRTETYAYDTNGQLVTAGYHDISGISAFTYNTDGYISGMTDPDGTGIAVTYANNKVEILETTTPPASGMCGAKRVYTYGTAETAVLHVVNTDIDTNTDTGKSIVYRFNANGSLASVSDETGRARAISYNESFESKPEDISSLQRINTNLVRHPDYSSCWTISGVQTNDSAGAYTTVSCNGTQCMRVKKKSTSGTITISGTLKAEAGKTYVYSAYVRTRIYTSAQNYIELKGAGDTSWTRSEIISATTDNDDISEGTGYTGWKRLSIVYTSISTQTVTVRHGVSSGVCETMFGCPQFEEGESADHVNLISNGEFRYTTAEGGNLPSDWSLGSDVNTGTGWCVIPVSETENNAVNNNVYVPGGNCLRLQGKPHADNITAVQEIITAGSAGDEYTLGCWMNAKGGEADTDQDAGIRVQFYSGSGWGTSVKLAYDIHEEGWQYGAYRINAPAAYTKMRVMLSYRKNINEAKYAGISLNRECYGKRYAYDTNGNRTSGRNKYGNSDMAAYDSYDNIITYVPAGHSAGTPIEIDYGDTFGKYHLPVSEKSSMDVYKRWSYHEEGVRTRERRIVYSEKDDTDPTMVETRTSYTDNYNYANKVKDARGNESTAQINAYTGTISEAQSPNGDTIGYTYDTSDRIITVTADRDSTHSSLNTYTYANDRISEIKHNTSGSANDVVYAMAYDALGANTGISVGNGTASRSIITKTYSSDRRHDLMSETYANGGSIEYTYDEYGRKISQRLDSSALREVTYKYGNRGSIDKITNAETGRTTKVSYDISGRETGTETKDITGNIVHRISVVYDECQRVSESRETIRIASNASATYRTRYVYDRDDRVVSTLFGEDDDTTRTNEVYDGLGRITRRATYNGGTETRIEENYTYAAGYTGFSANATTDLITGMSQSGMVQSYAYDVNGRIVSWTCNGKVCTYEYDGIGQLIRVNDEKDNRGGTDGTTWMYEYDNGGNITNRKKYAYTTGTVGTLLGTIPYAYGDTVWKDKLTSYNGTAITSDGIGNFTNDGTWTYTWFGGRRLASMTKTGTSIAYLYDENGQRIKKSVTENGTTTETDYTVCGKNVTHLHRGTDDLHIYYESGRPSHCKFNSSVYTYVYSLQGDVLGLKDSSGTLVVTYLYDAWGKEISRGGTLANTLGVINPFRYRGYVYDEETGLYYLRSRYYDPDIGRFISSDSILGQVGGLLQHNLFCYCDNYPITRKDSSGTFWESIFDIISLGASIVEVCFNPTDPLTWAGLGGDIVDLIPFVTGVGEATRAIKTTVKVVDKTDDIVDAAKVIYKTSDELNDIRKSTGSYEIFYKSGRYYVGKGGFKRAITSAKRNVLDYGDDVTAIMWKSAPNGTEAFIDEYMMQARNGFKIRGSSQKTYNLIWSPGRNLIEK